MTRPKYKGKHFQLFLGKCENVLKELPSNSVHSIVCDPPYELGFMGKSWDASGIAYNVDMWKEAMRVLKPGGYLLAFSGSRTYHRMVCAIEDAGFEIRDQIMWIYSSGFPKSQNVSKAIDKAAGAERKIVGVKPGHENFVGRDSIKSLRKDGALSSDGGFSRPWMHDKEAVNKYHMLTEANTDDAKEWEGWGTALKPAHEPICVARKPFKGTVVKNVLKHRTGAVNIDACRVGNENTRRPVGKPLNNGAYGSDRSPRESLNQIGGSDNGRWPANVVHDGSTDVQDAFARFGESKSRKGKPRGSAKPGDGWGMTKTGAEYNDEGSPARFYYCAKASKKDRDEGLHNYVDLEFVSEQRQGKSWESAASPVLLRVDMEQLPPKVIAAYGTPSNNVIEWNTVLFGKITSDQYLKVIKSTIKTTTNSTTKSEILSYLRHWITKENIQDVSRKTESSTSHVENAESHSLSVTITNEKVAYRLGVSNVVLPMRLKINVKDAKSDHPTVKPTELMRYLVRLVTPPNGIVLDPFMGSGSTGKACMLEGFKFAGIDMYPEYVELSYARITHALTKEKK